MAQKIAQIRIFENKTWVDINLRTVGNAVSLADGRTVQSFANNLKTKAFECTRFYSTSNMIYGAFFNEETKFVTIYFHIEDVTAFIGGKTYKIFSIPAAYKPRNIVFTAGVVLIPGKSVEIRMSTDGYAYAILEETGNYIAGSFTYCIE